MTELDTRATEIAAELRAGIEAGQAHQRLVERAAQADHLERELAFEQAGIPADGFGALFEAAYTGKPDVHEVRMAWAFVSGDTSGLTPAELHTYKLRLAQKGT